jgi:hypothetical protein
MFIIADQSPFWVGGQSGLTGADKPSRMEERSLTGSAVAEQCMDSRPCFGIK